MAWSAKTIALANGTQVSAKLPVIVSASRATDIPAFYMDWLMRQLRQGYTAWKNPFNGKLYWYSFEETRVIVFWSKNPAPLIPYMDEIRSLGFNFYLQYTVNDYEQEGYEPNLPPLQERLETFRQIAREIGPERMVWRFDPLFLTETVTIPVLLRRIERTGNALKGFTKRLTFSFADIEKYRKVKKNLQKHGIAYKLWDKAGMQTMAEKLSLLNRQWQYELATCAEPGDYTHSGILPGKCIDDERMARAFPHDKKLMQFLGRDGQQDIFGGKIGSRNLKDQGQRKSCRCIISKDIGFYNSCGHNCVYCYANVY